MMSLAISAVCGLVAGVLGVLAFRGARISASDPYGSGDRVASYIVAALFFAGALVFAFAAGVAL